MGRYIKELLLLVYLVLGESDSLSRLVELGPSLKGILFIGLFILVVAGLFAASYIQHTVTRIFQGVILFIGSVVATSYSGIMGEFLEYNSFISLLNAHGFVVEALIQFYIPIGVAVVLSLPLLIAILLPPKSKNTLIFKSMAGLPLVVILILIVAFYIRGGDGGRGLPPTFVPLAYTGLVVYESATNVIGERKNITISRKNKTVGRDVILVVDESISPAYLDINSHYGVVTPLSQPPKGINVYNYGYAASITNCSSEVNVTLRYGGTRENYLTHISTMPSIWQYAKLAGLRTVYIDAQRTNMRLQNGMTLEEIEYIDKFIQFDDTPIVERDLAAASLLIEYINNDTQEFIILNKLGGHFPVHDKYPDSFAKYLPILPRGNFLNVSDTGSRIGFSGESDAWVRYRNSYRNTLLWGVGQFFQQILDQANLSRAVIIYTSDHGQDLHENQSWGVNTHCSQDPRMEEGVVPLLIIEGEAGRSLDLERNTQRNKNFASQYNIFPTLLALMSYSPNEIEPIYGISLDQPTKDNMTFNTRFHARLGRKPSWKKVDPKELVVPIECKNTVKNCL